VKPAIRHAAGPAAVTHNGVGPVGVLVVDDSPVFRVGLCRAVRAHAGLELVGEAGGGEAALSAIAELHPEVVILDNRMPDLDGVEVLRRLRASDPPADCRVLLVSATLDPDVVEEAEAAGAARCLSKALSRADICTAAWHLARH
jgi:DNA-binding NarL/FixJ family response regulator